MCRMFNMNVGGLTDDEKDGGAWRFALGLLMLIMPYGRLVR